MGDRCGANSGLVIIAALLATGCGAEEVGTAELPIVGGTNRLASKTGSWAKQTSVAWVPSFQFTAGTMVIGFTQDDLAGWSFSSDWTAASPTWMARSWNDAGGWPADPPAEDGFDIDLQAYDSVQVAATGKRGQVVALAQATTGIVPFSDLVVLVSTDGGASFSSPRWVTDDGSRQGILYYDIAAQSKPGLDPDDEPGRPIWTVWRNIFGYWVRRMHLEADNRVVFDTAPKQCDIIAKDSGGVRIGSMLNAYGGETVYLAWSDRNDIYNDCPSTSTAEVRWNLSYSFDDGETWHPHQEITRDPSWPLCVGPSRADAGPVFGQNSSWPDFAIDPVNQACYLAVNKSMADGVGVEVLGTQDGATWTTVFTGPAADGGQRDQFGQALAVIHDAGQPQGRLAVTWYDTGNSLNNDMITRWGATSIDDGATWPLPGLITPLGPGVPWPLTDYLGNYDGVAGNPAGNDFLAAWADNRSAGTRMEVWAAKVAP